MAVEIQRIPDVNLKSSDVDVSKNSGTPKWMVYNRKPYLNRLAPVSRRPGRFVALDQGLWIAEKRNCI